MDDKIKVLLESDDAFENQDFNIICEDSDGALSLLCPASASCNELSRSLEVVQGGHYTAPNLRCSQNLDDNLCGNFQVHKKSFPGDGGDAFCLGNPLATLSTLQAKPRQGGAGASGTDASILKETSECDTALHLDGVPLNVFLGCKSIQGFVKIPLNEAGQDILDAAKISLQRDEMSLKTGLMQEQRNDIYRLDIELDDRTPSSEVAIVTDVARRPQSLFGTTMEDTLLHPSFGRVRQFAVLPNVKGTGKSRLVILLNDFTIMKCTDISSSDSAQESERLWAMNSLGVLPELVFDTYMYVYLGIDNPEEVLRVYNYIDPTTGINHLRWQVYSKYMLLLRQSNFNTSINNFSSPPADTLKGRPMYTNLAGREVLVCLFEPQNGFTDIWIGDLEEGVVAWGRANKVIQSLADGDFLLLPSRDHIYFAGFNSEELFVVSMELRKVGPEDDQSPCAFTILESAKDVKQGASFVRMFCTAYSDGMVIAAVLEGTDSDYNTLVLEAGLNSASLQTGTVEERSRVILDSIVDMALSRSNDVADISGVAFKYDSTKATTTSMFFDYKDLRVNASDALKVLSSRKDIEFSYEFNNEDYSRTEPETERQFLSHRENARFKTAGEFSEAPPSNTSSYILLKNNLESPLRYCHRGVGSDTLLFPSTNFVFIYNAPLFFLKAGPVDQRTLADLSALAETAPFTLPAILTDSDNTDVVSVPNEDTVQDFFRFFIIDSRESNNDTIQHRELSSVASSGDYRSKDFTLASLQCKEESDDVLIVKYLEEQFESGESSSGVLYALEGASKEVLGLTPSLLNSAKLAALLRCPQDAEYAIQGLGYSGQFLFSNVQNIITENSIIPQITSAYVSNIFQEMQLLGNGPYTQLTLSMFNSVLRFLCSLGGVSLPILQAKHLFTSARVDPEMNVAFSTGLNGITGALARADSSLRAALSGGDVQMLSWLGIPASDNLGGLALRIEELLVITELFNRDYMNLEQYHSRGYFTDFYQTFEMLFGSKYEAVNWADDVFNVSEEEFKDNGFGYIIAIALVIGLVSVASMYMNTAWAALVKYTQLMRVMAIITLFSHWCTTDIFTQLDRLLLLKAQAEDTMDELQGEDLMRRKRSKLRVITAGQEVPTYANSALSQDDSDRLNLAGPSAVMQSLQILMQTLETIPDFLLGPNSTSTFAKRLDDPDLMFDGENPIPLFDTDKSIYHNLANFFAPPPTSDENDMSNPAYIWHVALAAKGIPRSQLVMNGIEVSISDPQTGMLQPRASSAPRAPLYLFDSSSSEGQNLRFKPLVGSGALKGDLGQRALRVRNKPFKARTVDYKSPMKETFNTGGTFEAQVCESASSTYMTFSNYKESAWSASELAFSESKQQFTGMTKSFTFDEEALSLQMVQLSESAVGTLNLVLDTQGSTTSLARFRIIHFSAQGTEAIPATQTIEVQLSPGATINSICRLYGAPDEAKCLLVILAITTEGDILQMVDVTLAPDAETGALIATLGTSTSTNVSIEGLGVLLQKSGAWTTLNPVVLKANLSIMVEGGSFVSDKLSPNLQIVQSNVDLGSFEGTRVELSLAFPHSSPSRETGSTRAFVYVPFALQALYNNSQEGMADRITELVSYHEHIAEMVQALEDLEAREGVQTGSVRVPHVEFGLYGYGLLCCMSASFEISDDGILSTQTLVFVLRFGTTENTVMRIPDVPGNFAQFASQAFSFTSLHVYYHVPNTDNVGRAALAALEDATTDEGLEWEAEAIEVDKSFSRNKLFVLRNEDILALGDSDKFAVSVFYKNLQDVDPLSAHGYSMDADPKFKTAAQQAFKSDDEFKAQLVLDFNFLRAVRKDFAFRSQFSGPALECVVTGQRFVESSGAPLPMFAGHGSWTAGSSSIPRGGELLSSQNFDALSAYITDNPSQEVRVYLVPRGAEWDGQDVTEPPPFIQDNVTWGGMALRPFVQDDTLFTKRRKERKQEWELVMTAASGLGLLFMLIALGLYLGLKYAKTKDVQVKTAKAYLGFSLVSFVFCKFSIIALSLYYFNNFESVFSIYKDS